MAETTVDHALADFARQDSTAADAARSAFDWLTAGEGLDAVTMHRLADFLWYQLPVKWDGDVQEKVFVAGALGELFRRLDRPAVPGDVHLPDDRGDPHRVRVRRRRGGDEGLPGGAGRHRGSPARHSRTHRVGRRHGRRRERRVLVDLPRARARDRVRRPAPRGGRLAQDRGPDRGPVPGQPARRPDRRLLGPVDAGRTPGELGDVAQPHPQPAGRRDRGPAHQPAAATAPTRASGSHRCSGCSTTPPPAPR